MTETIDLQALRGWIGRTRAVSDTIEPRALEGLAAVLDYETPPWPQGELPPLGHWLYFLTRAPSSEIDPDGHVKRGGFLPPIPLPRRMWAGGRITFHRPLRLGSSAERRSSVIDISHKSGKSRDSLFLVQRHEVTGPEGLAVSEEQDLVYRAAAVGAASSPAPLRPDPAEAIHVRRIEPDAVLLFRYSALTFNAHRIHYDRDYTREVEGYPGLLVQGPLQATLLVDHFLRHFPGRRVRRFDFRAQTPVFDTAPFELCLSPTADGAVAWLRTEMAGAAMVADISAD